MGRTHYVREDSERILLDQETIMKRVAELAKQISADYENKNLVAVCILKGSVMFFSDLMKEVTIPCELEFMSVSSYGSGSSSSGNVKIKYDLQDDIRDKDILIVEDIVDSGITLHNLTNLLKQRNPASLKICCLLDKKERRVAEIDVDYVGFEIPDEFVIGYGLDFDGKYRNYGEIGILKRELYE